MATPPQGQGSSLGESPATPEQERPRRRQPSAARSSRGTRDQSVTQFAVMDDENVSQQVGFYSMDLKINEILFTGLKKTMTVKVSFT